MRRFYRVGLLLTLCLVASGCDHQPFYKITHYLPDGTKKVYEGYNLEFGYYSNNVDFTDVQTRNRFTITGEFVVERIRDDVR